MRIFANKLSVIAALLIVAAFGLAACGSSDDDAQSAKGGGSGDDQGAVSDGESTSATTMVSETETVTTNENGREASQSARRRAAALSPSARRAVRAVRLAARRVNRGRGLPYDLETEHYRGMPVWEVEVASGHARPFHVIVNARANKVLRVRRKRRDDDATKVRRAKVPLAKAIRIADRRTSGRFDEAEIDRSRGRLVWDVSYDRRGGTEVEITVDARSGKVLRVEVDD